MAWRRAAENPKCVPRVRPAATSPTNTTSAEVLHNSAAEPCRRSKAPPSEYAVDRLNTKCVASTCARLDVRSRQYWRPSMDSAEAPTVSPVQRFTRMTAKKAKRPRRSAKRGWRVGHERGGVGFLRLRADSCPALLDCGLFWRWGSKHLWDQSACRERRSNITRRGEVVRAVALFLSRSLEAHLRPMLSHSQERAAAAIRAAPLSEGSSRRAETVFSGRWAPRERGGHRPTQGSLAQAGLPRALWSRPGSRPVAWAAARVARDFRLSRKTRGKKPVGPHDKKRSLRPRFRTR